MKKAFLFTIGSIILLFILFFVCRFVIFVPEHYHTPEPECNQAETFDLSIAGTAHLSELKTNLKTKSPNSYRYFFKTFLEENKIYMVVNFRNEKECFDVKILVDKWDKLTGMRWANGKSYPKELYDLKWEVEEVNGVEEVVYLDMHPIID